MSFNLCLHSTYVKKIHAMKSLFIESASKTPSLLVLKCKGTRPVRVEEVIDLLLPSSVNGCPFLVAETGAPLAMKLRAVTSKTAGRVTLSPFQLAVLCLRRVATTTPLRRSSRGKLRRMDRLWAISTSGNSTNIIRSIEATRTLGMKTIGMTGEGGGKMATLCDVLLNVPGNETPRIQELNIVL